VDDERGTIVESTHKQTNKQANNEQTNKSGVQFSVFSTQHSKIRGIAGEVEKIPVIVQTDHPIYCIYSVSSLRALRCASRVSRLFILVFILVSSA